MRYNQSSSVIKTITNTQSLSILRKTYLLLSINLFFSALMALWSMRLNTQPNFIFFLIAIFALPMLAMKFRDSAWGLVATFAYTGTLGFFIGPLLNHVIANSGPQVVSTALGATATIFLTLSAYTLVSKKNFSYLGGLLSVGILIAFMAGIGAMIFQLPMLQLGVSAAFALLSSGYILYMTSALINGGETSYVVATISLFASIMNLFISLLNILSFFGGGGNRN
ncbi:MAG: hypothetical protein A3F17_04460 [Gammaproteobacteria bacterium RIFCSPHIGHO2_12_FULL_41_15]|nr:MAG: hypothetical protein A3F17_04460 [Gammaproteobacteria bacterium RIFCSPHIGHO2_12_FULL_41_15]